MGHCTNAPFACEKIKTSVTFVFALVSLLVWFIFSYILHFFAAENETTFHFLVFFFCTNLSSLERLQIKCVPHAQSFYIVSKSSISYLLIKSQPLF